MKKSAKLKRKTKRLLIKNLIVLVVLIAVASVGVRSWFTDHTTATATGLAVQAKTNFGLEYFIVAPNNDNTVEQGYSAINTWISTYNTNHASDTGFVAKEWHTGALTLDFEDPEFGFLSDLFLSETTGDGYTFKIPKLIQYGEIAYVDTEESFDDATANLEYMSFDLYFRSKSSFDVVLKSGSSISPVGTIDTSTDEGMKPAAIGAVRMSVYNGNTRELLWIPGPNVWFDGTANNYEGELHTNYTGNNNTFKPGGNVTVLNDQITLTGDGTNEHWYFDESTGQRVKVSGAIASTAGNYQLGSDVTVVTLENMNDTNNDDVPDDGYYYNRIRVNLWIEGEDAESRLKFVGGKFNLTMNFDVED